MQRCRSPANWRTPAVWRLPPTKPGPGDLLLSLIPRIEREDRDDLMLEVLAQLGEIYLARGANDGVQESIRRIRDCLAIYSGIVAGTMPRPPSTCACPTPRSHMICRYSRRAQFLQTGLAAALGDHEGAATALAVLSDADSDSDFPSSPRNTRTCASMRKSCARLRCATTTCMCGQFRCGSRCLPA